MKISREPKHDLVYDNFKEYEVPTNDNFLKETGIEHQYFLHKFKFKNGFGASVVKHFFSYGYADDLFELAVLDGNAITYDTPITNDVLGCLSNEEVLEILERIKNMRKFENVILVDNNFYNISNN